LEPLVFTRPDGLTIALPERFLTDLASTPRVVWPIHGLAPADMERPSLAHDWLYVSHHRGVGILGFSESNRVLQEACLCEGYSRPMAWAVRRACDLFGRGIWNRNSDPRPNDTSGASRKVAAGIHQRGWSVSARKAKGANGA
jgi:hypothetical protein